MSRILVIDDDSEVRALLRRILEKGGHAVAEASDGADGTRRFEDEQADLVITDIIMPEMDGLENIAALRKRAPNLPILAISGGGRRVDRDFLPAAQAFGADAVLYKPFGADEVLDLVVRMLNGEADAVA